MVDAYMSGKQVAAHRACSRNSAIIGPADETRLCIFERGPGGKLERAEDRCVPKTETGDDMARHSAKCNKMKHTWRTERTARVAELRAQEQAAAQAQPPAQQAHL